jgi:RimJ/RimL family protein N-acetyltransferase
MTLVTARFEDRPERLIHLADGGQCRIRPSGPFDRDRLATCFQALSPASRRLRFFAVKRQLQAAELDLYSTPDGRDHLALAAVRLDPLGREREALGFARCQRLPGDPESAELSLSVIDSAQGQGIGSALLGALIEAARAQGIRRFRCEVLAENVFMRRLAARLGGEPKWLGDGTLEYDCPLPALTGAEAKPEPDLDLTWLADPSPWLLACTQSWLIQLDQALAIQRAANDRLGLWLQDACPALPDRGRRAA